MCPVQLNHFSRPGKTRVLSSTQQIYSSDKVQWTECELAEPETLPRLNCFAFLKKLPRRWNALFGKWDFFLFYILSWFLAYQALDWDFPGLVVHLLGLQSLGRSIGLFSWRLDHMYVMPKIVRREPYCRAKFEASTLSKQVLFNFSCLLERRNEITVYPSVIKPARGPKGPARWER